MRRLGTDGSTAKAIKLLEHWDGQADAIGLGVAKDSHGLGARRLVERDSMRMQRAVTRVPVTTGLDDDTSTEIVKGELKVNDQVIVTEQRDAAKAAATPQLRL